MGHLEDLVGTLVVLLGTAPPPRHWRARRKPPLHQTHARDAHARRWGTLADLQDGMGHADPPHDEALRPSSRASREVDRP